MSKNCNKIKATCGTKNFAPCVEYQKELPSFTKLTGCNNLEETTDELYTLVGEIRTQTDLSALGEKCLTYVLDSAGKKIVKNVLLKQEQEICDLKAKVLALETTDICTKSITACNFNFGTLVDPCGIKPQTLGQTIQVILNKIKTP